MEDWDFFMGGSDFGHFVPGADLPPHELSWFVSYIDSGATNLEICADNDYGYIFYSLPLLEGDSFGVDKISLKDGKKIWGRVYQKAINAQPCCHDEFVFAEGVFINKCDGSVIDFFSFPGCEEGLYYSFISEGKIFLSEKGVRAKGGFWCDLANLNEKEEFNGRIVCSLSDGRVVKSEGDCLYVFPLESGVQIALL